MAETFYQQRAEKKFPQAAISGEGPHGVFLAAKQAVVLYQDFYDARTAAEGSGGRQFFISKPVAGIYNDSFGYRERSAASA